jgi:hypothetical protein
MHRMRIGLIAAAALLAATLGIYFATMTRLERAGLAEAEQRAVRASKLYGQLHHLRGVAFAKLAAESARHPGLAAIFEQADETRRREVAFEEAEALSARLAKAGRKADLVAILDASGKVVARDLNPEAMFGEDLKERHPAVGRALGGEAVKDVWHVENRMTEVAVAPIYRSGAVGGALLLGYVLSAAQAQEARRLLEVDVAYLNGGKAYASSFVIAGTEGKEDTGRTQALAPLASAAGGGGEVKLVEFEGQRFAVVGASMHGNVADRTSGFLFLAAPANALRAAVGPSLLLIGLLGILIALAAAIMTAKRFLRPLDQVELGLEEVISGNIDYTFKPVGPDFEGLSNRLNVMLARLLGREEPNEDAVEEEEEPAQKWRADQMVLEEGDGSAAPQVAQTLGAESEAAYYPRLYNEYITTLRSLGRSTDGLSVPAFMAKLRLAEAGLREKWSCRVVRFQLVTRGNEPVFRAVRVA